MAANGKKPRHLLDEADSKFARALGSTDYHTREAGLAALTAWLGKRNEVEELELLKLWRGVFYAFWHSDKHAVQTSLAERLSEIMTQLPEQVGWQYYTTFMRTMRREWAGIDRLRLDKFMMLIRKFFAASLSQLQAHSWQPRRVQRLADFWLGEILVPHDTLVAAGVAFHLSDLLLPELAKCLQQGQGGGGGAAAAAPEDGTLRALLEPFCQALAAAPSPALIFRLRQGVFDPLLEDVRQPGEGAPLRNLDVAALAAHLFDLGAKAETRARNREALYAISAALEKAAAKQQQQQGGGGQQRPRKQQAAGGQQQQQQGEQQQQQVPKSAQKKARRGQKQQQEEQEQQQAVPMEEVAVTEAEEPPQQHHAADGRQQQKQAEQPPPTSSRKGKKRQQEQAENGAAAADASPSPAPAAGRRGQQEAAPAAAEPAAAAATPPLPAPPPSSSKKKQKKSRLGSGAELAPAQQAQQQQADEEGQQQPEQRGQPHEVPAVERELLAAALAAVTGSGAGASAAAAAARTPGASPSKKSVRFSLKRNLVNVIGQPPKPADVRTPPTAKPKGSALKKEGLIGGPPGSAPERLLTRAGVGRMAQLSSYLNGRAAGAAGGPPGSASKAEGGGGSAPAPPSSKKQRQQRRASLPAPGSFSRPRACEFF